jgi:TetR/AcrR family transcriptional repressor of bet genes
MKGSAPMAREPRRPKFHRAPPTVRREALIAATLACLRAHGHDGVSARRIGAAAGVSPGLITHHFPSISSLVAAAYEQLAMSLLQSIEQHARQTQATARERLRRFFQASFAPGLLEPGLFNTWLVFWSMAAHDASVRAVHGRTYVAYRAALESMLQELSGADGTPPFKLRPAAIALSALLDGLWIEASMNPRTFKPAEAVGLCEDWINALSKGAFPSLLDASPARSAHRHRARTPRRHG